MTNKDMPAYPGKLAAHNKGECRDPETGAWISWKYNAYTGLTKLEAFTMAALQGLCVGRELDITHGELEAISSNAVILAEAALAELEKRK